MADTRPDIRPLRQSDHAWHVAINCAAIPFGVPLAPHGTMADGKHFMYTAKTAAFEVPRLALLFARERRGELSKVHHQCSHDIAGTPIKSNHLTCCLGVVCAKCPFLAAIDAMPERFVGWNRDAHGNATTQVTERVPDEERDVIKAWTCATHIIARGGDPANEGFVLTVDDQMYWDNLHQSLAEGSMYQLPPEATNG